MKQIILTLILMLISSSIAHSDCQKECNVFAIEGQGAKYQKCMQDCTGAECPENMAYIPPGEFMMGCSPDDNECENDEKPTISVKITNGICMDAYEFPNKNGETPLIDVDWYEAKEFCDEKGKRLPNESEWEYAARAGSITRFYWGQEMESEKTNYCDINCDFYWKDKSIDDGYSSIAPAGNYQPNAWGIYDMSGNLAEWVYDCYDESWYSEMTPTNPVKNCGGGEYRVIRGGMYEEPAQYCRISMRVGVSPLYENDYLGFRCVQDLNRPTTNNN